MKTQITILVLILCFSCKNEIQNASIPDDDRIQVSSDSVDEQDEIELLKLKKQDQRFYHITLDKLEEEKDTIVNFDFFESDEALSYTFNYKPFENNITNDTLSMFTTNMEVVIEKANFNASKATVTYNKDSLNVVAVNGKKPFGADAIPKTYISNMYLIMSGNTTLIDKKYYDDLYEPDFYRANAYYYDNEIIITMHNSDGYLGYSVSLFIDRFNNVKRIVHLP